MSPSKSNNNDSSIGEIAEAIHDYTERNGRVVGNWLTTKLDELASTDHTLAGVVLNLSMVTIGLAAVAAEWGTIADVAGVAWAVLNGWPLLQAVWEWLL